MKGMRVDMTSLVADIDAALTLAEVSAALSEQGLTLDLDARAPLAETVAAWLAAGAP